MDGSQVGSSQKDLVEEKIKKIEKLVKVSLTTPIFTDFIQLFSDEEMAKMKKMKTRKLDKLDPELAERIKNYFNYSLKISAHEVFDNIFVGNRPAASNVEYLQSQGIDHLINAAEKDPIALVEINRESMEKEGIKYFGFVCLDDEDSDLSPFFQESSDFIEAAVSSGGKVLVSCMGGMSRSATLVIAYLVGKVGMNLEDALLTVKKKRDVYPNEAFIRQLVEFEGNILKKGQE